MNKLKVVLSLITHDNDYQLEQAKAAEAAAHQGVSTWRFFTPTATLSPRVRNCWTRFTSASQR